MGVAGRGFHKWWEDNDFLCCRVENPWLFIPFFEVSYLLQRWHFKAVSTGTQVFWKKCLFLLVLRCAPFISVTRQTVHHVCGVLFGQFFSSQIVLYCITSCFGMLLTTHTKPPRKNKGSTVVQWLASPHSVTEFNSTSKPVQRHAFCGDRLIPDFKLWGKNQ